MKKVYIPTRSGGDWKPLLAKPDAHWKPGASAMTAAACWEAAGRNLPPEIGAKLASSNDAHLAGLQLLIAMPEWEVELPGGATTSHTDVLAICRNEVGLCVIGVEAKVLEDFGPLVGEKRKDASKGQLERLAFLHEQLEVSGYGDDVRYQLLHRTVSALLTARQFHANTAVMLVHAFDCPEDRKGDFTRFANATGAEPIAPDVYRVRRFDEPRLYLAWCAGDSTYRDVDLREDKGWYNGYSWNERAAKLKELQRRIARGEQKPAHGPCDLCNDPDVPVEYHDEDYSKPYLWGPPALFSLCRNCHRDKLHKRFTRPAAWQAFLAHVRRGGYGRDLKNPQIKKAVAAYEDSIDRGESATLAPLRSYGKTPGTEWFANLSVDPVTLTDKGARPRP